MVSTILPPSGMSPDPDAPGLGNEQHEEQALPAPVTPERIEDQNISEELPSAEEQEPGMGSGA